MFEGGIAMQQLLLQSYKNQYDVLNNEYIRRKKRFDFFGGFEDEFIGSERQSLIRIKKKAQKCHDSIVKTNKDDESTHSSHVGSRFDDLAQQYTGLIASLESFIKDSCGEEEVTISVKSNDGQASNEKLNRQNPFLDVSPNRTDDDLEWGVIGMYDDEKNKMLASGSYDQEKWFGLLQGVFRARSRQDSMCGSVSSETDSYYEKVKSEYLKRIAFNQSFEDAKTANNVGEESCDAILHERSILKNKVMEAKKSHKNASSRFDDMKTHIGDMLSYPGGFASVCQYMKDNKDSINHHRDYTGWLRQHVFGGRATDTYMAMLRTLAEKAPFLEKSKMTGNDRDQADWLSSELSTHGVKLHLTEGLKGIENKLDNLMRVLSKPVNDENSMVQGGIIVRIRLSLKTGLCKALSQAQVKSNVSDTKNTISLCQTCSQMADDCERLAGSKDDQEAEQLRTNMVKNIDDLLALSKDSYKGFYEKEHKELESIKDDIENLLDPSQTSGPRATAG
jgi:hypothetical protein